MDNHLLENSLFRKCLFQKRPKYEEKARLHEKPKDVRGGLLS